MGFSKQLSENMEYFHTKLNLDKNFDVVYRVARIGGKNACIYFVDGLTKDDVLMKVLQIWEALKPEELPEDAHEFSKLYLPYGEAGACQRRIRNDRPALVRHFLYFY